MPEPHYPYDTTVVSELLKQKRKARGIKACFPCRHRKVRCDGHVPCASCIKRGHSELCRVPTSSTSAAGFMQGQGQGNNKSTSVLSRPESLSSPQDDPADEQQDAAAA